MDCPRRTSPSKDCSGPRDVAAELCLSQASHSPPCLSRESSGGWSMGVGGFRSLLLRSWLHRQCPQQEGSVCSWLLPVCRNNSVFHVENCEWPWGAIRSTVTMQVGGAGPRSSCERSCSEGWRGGRRRDSSSCLFVFNPQGNVPLLIFVSPHIKNLSL